MTAAYAAAKAFLYPLFSSVWRMKVYGRENVPMRGPLVVACNHVSYADPPVLGTASPRQISYMAKQELFAIPVLGPMIRSFGAYPVDRHGSASAAIKRSVEVLRDGGAIGIFPEGTRNLDGSAEVRQGVALLASLGRAPVVPACVIGTNRIKRLRQIKVVFGEPMHLPEGRKATREEMAKFTDEVMSAIRALAQRFDGN
ncbi:MAG: 1-acyl-sn-glycerol-3-phosphate acyltransferase [Candidatus Eremiobacteraeota bacterium]|nr:1-acyl-sn-glycerol-3-phosphate acyltransferase [Candidatus Eremiobacteraeota bacterium]